MTDFVLLSGLGHAMLVVAGLLVYVMFTRIDHQRRHPSAALAWVLFLVVAVFAAIAFKSSKYWVFYSADKGGKNG